MRLKFEFLKIVYPATCKCFVIVNAVLYCFVIVNAVLYITSTQKNLEFSTRVGTIAHR